MQITDEMLKPCPFCGGQAEEVFPDASTRHFIRCTNCGGRSALNLASHGGSAKDDWNRRAAHSSAEAALAAAPAVAVKPLEDRIEDLARWIHSEVEWPEYDFHDHSWPDHPRDDGKRGDGYLKIIPRSSADQFREIAARIIASFASPVAQATDVPEGLADRCRDVLEWKRTGLLLDGALRAFAAKLDVDDPFGVDLALGVAEKQTAEEAMRFVIAAAPTPKAEGDDFPAFKPSIHVNELAGVAEMILEDVPTITGQEMTVRPLLRMDGERDIVGFQWYVPIERAEGEQ